MTARRDSRYLTLAHRVAEIFSKDPSTKVGAVVTGEDHRDLAIGYNGFPPCIADDDRLLDRDVKIWLIIHAERNALDNANFDTRGGTLHVTFHPCHDCAKSIVSRGIERVVIPRDVPDELRTRWKESAEVAAAIFKESGVEVIEI